MDILEDLFNFYVDDNLLYINSSHTEVLFYFLRHLLIIYKTLFVLKYILKFIFKKLNADRF